MVATTSKFSRQKPGTSTRQFTIMVDPIVFRSKPSKSSNIRSIQVSKNVYFYSDKNYRLPVSYENEAKIIGIMYSYIMGLIEKESQRLITFWYNNVNLYFNRRAYGVSHAGGPYKPKMKQLGKVKTAYISNTRQHTGQLRGSLTLRTLNVYGAQLYARAVYAKTNNADYINILMKGASPKPGAYIRRLNLRVKRGYWKGIPSRYWMNWQHRFMREIRKSEVRLQQQIKSYVERMKVLTPKQIKAARESYKSKEFETVISKDMKNMRIELGKEKYSISRGLDPSNKYYPFEQTWEGMKQGYYSNEIETNPLTANLSQPAHINEVIRRRKNWGRSH